MDLTRHALIEGDFIRLQTITEDDANEIFAWRTSESGMYLNQPENYSIESQKAWIKNKAQSKSEINYVIIAKESNEKVGMISIIDIDEQNKRAEVGRLLLDAKYLSVSNPFGLEALKITYSLVLNDWKLNKIYGTISSANVGMIKLQQYLGMEQEGILKNHLMSQGEFVHLHLFSLFHSAINSKYLPRINFLLKAFKS
jgi:[ribosomal protein S5]-alanine N-acetyltransferase